MGAFSPEERFVGIDLGAGTIKLVELMNEKGQARLVTYGTYELPFSQIATDDWSTRKLHAVEALRVLMDQAKVTSKLAVASLPTFSVFSSLVTVPDVGPKELPNVVRLEAKKVVPKPIDQMQLNWVPISTSKPQDGNQDSNESGVIDTKQAAQKKLLITAAPKDLVEHYVDIFKELGLRLVSLETEALALSRALIGKDPSVVMIADIGAKSTNLSIIEKGIPLVNRGVNFGGKRVTEMIAKRMGVSEEQADQLKHDIAANHTSDELSKALAEVMEDVIHEIEYLFQLYRRQFQSGNATSSTIDKVVLAGGSAFVPGLSNFLANQLNVPVYLGDPWARVVYPEDLRPVLQEMGPSMAVAVGLAMKHIKLAKRA